MDNAKKVSGREKFGYFIVDLSGTIDYEDMLEVDSLIKESAREGNQTILLNFKEVDFLNASAISVLLNMVRELPKENKNLNLLEVSNDIQNLLRMNNNLSYFTIIQNEDDLMDRKRSQELNNFLNDSI
jgi:anti-anti-sigma factor